MKKPTYLSSVNCLDNEIGSIFDSFQRVEEQHIRWRDYVKQTFVLLSECPST